MADIINAPTYEQIAVILSKLATNYSNLASVFYDVFYNTTPADVTLKMYDESGVLQTYTIPNRAKDMANIINGKGTPENAVAAGMGVTYQDLENGKLYVKETANGNEGWSEVATNNYISTFFIKGAGSPEGQVVARKGVLYVDEESVLMYIKETNSSSTGWKIISSSADAFAFTDLSNITEFGKGKIVEIVESNFTQTVLTEESTDSQYPSAKCVYDLTTALKTDVTILLNDKQNVSNLVTSVSAASTDSQYPSAKCLYDVRASLNTSIDAKQDKSNLVTTLTSSSTNSQYPSAKCVYDLIGNLEYIINNL